MNPLTIPIVLTALLLAAVYERRNTWHVLPVLVIALFAIPTIWAIYFAVLYFNK